MPSTDPFAPYAAPTDRTQPMTETTVDPITARQVRQLLTEARLVEDAFDTTPSAAATATAPTVPVPPPGYTLKTVHHTTPDGGSRVEYEVVPLAPITPATGPAEEPRAPGRRSLPAWLTANGRKIKVAAYLAGGGALTAGIALYGPALGAGISAAAAGVWAATMTALKVIGVVLGGMVVLGVLCGGRNKKAGGGTFEFSGTGTWKEGR